MTNTNETFQNAVNHDDDDDDDELEQVNCSVYLGSKFRQDTGYSADTKTRLAIDNAIMIWMTNI